MTENGTQYYFSEDSLGMPIMLEKNSLSEKEKIKLLAERARKVQMIFWTLWKEMKEEDGKLDEPSFNVAMVTSEEIIQEMKELGRSLYGYK